MRRIVVTGIGLVTPLGASISSSWQSLINSKSGIRKIPPALFDTCDLSTQIAGLIPLADEPNGLLLDKYISNKEQRKMDKFIQYAIVAAVQAIEDSGWVAETEYDQSRTGVLIGSGIGGLIVIEQNSKILQEHGPRRISPFFIPACLINLASGHISMRYNFKGPNHAVVTACATGAHAIGDAARIIKDGDADIMICGGAEAAICRLGIAGFAAARALSTRNDEPEQASRPWDKDRDGFVMGEGSGILVLEEFEHARKRGAKIYGELIGYGLAGDAYHITAPDPNGDGAYRAMKMALNKAQINADTVDYINAHGTSTPLGDLIELQAVKRIFGDAAYKIPMSSTKSSIGHLLGAAGSVEAIFCLLTMQDNIIPPTINLHNPSEECNMDLVPHVAKEAKVKTTMTNAFGFGGTNTSLIFKLVG